jgi:hypothetical protein
MEGEDGEVRAGTVAKRSAVKTGTHPEAHARRLVKERPFRAAKEFLGPGASAPAFLE